MIYEAHVKGMTVSHPEIAGPRAGTFEGLGSPQVVEHLAKLGVTAVELMPIQAFFDDRPCLVFLGYSGAGGEPVTAPGSCKPVPGRGTPPADLTSLNSCVGLEARRHGQEPRMTRNHIGVDLSKDALDVFDPIRGETRIANARAPIARWASRLGPEDFVVFEATSGCDRVLRAGLEAAGRDFVRLNPLHVWHFARSLNLAKTDRMAEWATRACSPGSGPSASRLRTRTATPSGRSCARSATAATS